MLILTRKAQPIESHGSYKKAIERVTVLQTLLEDEEKRILNYLRRKSEENSSKKQH